MGFVFAIKYDQNAVDLSCEFQTLNQKVKRRKGALFDEPIYKNNLLFAEV